MARADVECRLKKISIEDDGVLCYNGKQFLTENRLPAFQNIEFKRVLSNGANGITFIVFHKYLKIEQLVKLYFITDDKFEFKAIEETKKNSNVKLGDTIARVYDSGKLIFPVPVYYSIMELVENSITLKDYLKARASLISVLQEISPSSKELNKDSVFDFILQEGLNLCIYFLRDISYLIKYKIRHGDLNPGNIMIGGSILTEHLIRLLDEYNKIKKNKESDPVEFEKIKKEILFYKKNCFQKISVGEIRQDSLQVKLIDLGTSHVNPSTVKKTNQRDSWFIFSTIRKILSPIFDELSIDFHDYFYLKQVGESHVKKLEYNFKLEEYSELRDYYESNLYPFVQFHVENGKLDLSTLSVDEKSSIIQQWSTHNSFSDELDVLIQEYTNSPLSTVSKVDDIIIKMLIEEGEIFNNLQILPHKLQFKLVSKELMFESSTQYNGQIPYQMLSYEMFKFVAVTNLLLGLIFHQGNFDSLGVQSNPIYRDLASIINYNNVSSVEDVSHRFFISDIFDYKFYETGSILLNLNEDKKLWSNNILIDFDSYINDFIQAVELVK
ncbi:hypothetical protein [Streptococcus sp. Marseille-P7376]|uniref:hypothetical protein n=1 Tax=Streptococcus sp. Marseille-P7376 TaxID=2592044 RepID=UPI0011E63A09|nr:hypothetical protein [Streptococcus sp. Marseille-P7376]